MVEALSSLHDPNSMARMQQSLITHVNEWLVFTHIYRMIYDIYTDVIDIYRCDRYCNTYASLAYASGYTDTWPDAHTDAGRIPLRERIQPRQ